jgi:UDP-N-acetylmuramoylalanine--D-glutamate ligase
MQRGKLKIVVGLGKTGLSCVRHLLARGHHVAVTDSRPNPPYLKELQDQFPHVDVQLGGFDEKFLSRASELVVSPGVSIKEPAIVKQAERAIPIVGDIELFARQTRKPVVAITGSNGKSTVTSLVGQLALDAGINAKLGGNLGTPVLDLLDDKATELYVIELSSFQLETTYSLTCLSAVNLNISADHMDRYSSLEEYIAAKLRIYRHCTWPVIYLDDPKSYASFQFKKPPIGFTLKEPQENCYGLRTFLDQTYLAHGEKRLLRTAALPLKGQHQYGNVLASLALGSAIGLSLEGMLHSITTFRGLPHRCQWLANIEGVDWYNDSKATNVGSAQAAILGIGSQIAGKLVLLAGGQGKNARFSDLYDDVAKFVKALILYGEDKYRIAEALQGATHLTITDDLYSATKLAEEIASQGDAVILAPACASYDMFKNFEHRGEIFMEIIRGIIHEKAAKSK